MGETDWVGNWVLFWWVGPWPVNFLLMGRVVFPLCCLTWGKTMVETMKIMETFKWSCAYTARTQCPWPCTRPLLPHASAADAWTLTGKSGSVSCGVTAPFSSVLVHARVLFVPSKSVFPQSCVSSGGSTVGLMVTSSKRAYVVHRSAAPRAPTPFIRPLLTHTSIWFRKKILWGIVPKSLNQDLKDALLWSLQHYSQ